MMKLFSLLPLLLACASASASANSALLRRSTQEGQELSSNHSRHLLPLEQPDPALVCEDEKKENDKFKLKENGQMKTCNFYANNDKCEKMIQCGKDKDKSVWEVCQMSCASCGRLIECTDEKENDKFKLKEEGKKKTCAFYADNDKCEKTIQCGDDKDKSVWEVCQMSCASCGRVKECRDEKNRKEKFKLKEGGKKKTCKWYADNDKCEKMIQCEPDKDKSVWEVCQKTCGKCDV